MKSRIRKGKLFEVTHSKTKEKFKVRGDSIFEVVDWAIDAFAEDKEQASYESAKDWECVHFPNGSTIEIELVKNIFSKVLYFLKREKSKTFLSAKDAKFCLDNMVESGADQ